MSSVLYMLLLKMLIYIIKCLVEHVKVTTDSHVCSLCERLGVCFFTVLKIYFNSAMLRTLSRGGASNTIVNETSLRVECLCLASGTAVDSVKSKSNREEVWPLKLSPLCAVGEDEVAR